MFTFIGAFRFHTFTLYLSLAMLCGASVAALRLRGQLPWRVIGDVVVAMLAGGFAFARLEYVLLNWDVFAGEPARVFNMITGGLDWHGALVGAVLGLWLVAKVHRLDMRLLLDAFLPLLPLVAFAGFTACRKIGCVYGAEVETLAYYPGWMVTEGRDIFGIVAPRYDTYAFGQWLSWGLLVMVGLLWVRDRLVRVRVGLIVGVFCAGMFVLGFVRADYAPVWLSLRADQWLDAGMLAMVVSAALRWR